MSDPKTKKRVTTKDKLVGTGLAKDEKQADEIVNAGFENGLNNAPSETEEVKFATVKLTNKHPCNMRGVVTLAQYRPDADGVITVDKRDAETLRERFGWRDVDS